MKAADVIAAIRRANSGFPLLEELVVNDPVAIAEWTTIQDEARARAIETGDWEERARTTANLPPTSRRIDALLIDQGGRRTAIEVKISRADYKRETEAKRRPWAAICHRFVYAVPAGLIQPEEVPDGIGLWWILADGSVKTVKKCRVKRSPDPVPAQLFTALCYRAMKEAA